MHITLAEFEASLENATFPLAVAVSGGADSLALLLLAHEFAQHKGSHVIGLTVNHNLRPESKEEAHRVGQWAQEQGIKHIILEWGGDKPSSRLQEKARNARYTLLTKWCKQHQISTLLLGHHQQDQEETFWLRLCSGSGLNGLSGMKKRIVRDEILCLRPLLNVSKDRIKETLKAKSQEWIEDPSNESPQFFRGRLRRFLKEEGLSFSRLTQVMNKLRMDADFIQASVQQAIETVVHAHDSGYLTIEKKLFYELHPAIAKRVLSFVVQWFSGADYSPRTSQITNVMSKIERESSFTTNGIYWTFSQEKIFLFRERRATKQKFFISDLQKKTFWDQRFWIDEKLRDYISPDITLGALEFAPTLKKAVTSSIPTHAWPTLPTLWEKGEVVAVPHLCYDLLKCGEDLKNFICLKPLFHDSLRFTI